jgi:pyruvate formate lyase activating enzyme
VPDDRPGAGGAMAEQDDSPVVAYLHGPSMIDFPGRLALVAFVAGCNLRCGYCHNPALLGPPRAGLAWAQLEALVARFAAQWVDAVAVTGGEPTFSPGLPDLLRFFKRAGWAVKLDTNGSLPAVLEQCLPLVDFVAMDIKVGPSAYGQFTGFTDTEAIRRSIALVRQCALYEFRTTILESVHDDNQMREIGELIAGADRYVLQPFVPRDDLPDHRLRDEQRPRLDRMQHIAAMMLPYVKEVILRGA